MSKFLFLENQIALGIKTLTPLVVLRKRLLGDNFVAKMAKKFNIQKTDAKQFIQVEFDEWFARKTTESVVFWICYSTIGSRSSLKTLAKAASEICGKPISNNLAGQYRNKFRDCHGLNEDCRTNETQFKRDMRRSDYN